MTEKRKTKEESDFFMDFAEEELREVDKLFTTGELNAFGSKEESVLKQIVHSIISFNHRITFHNYKSVHF
jgi:hypothetical protein